MKYFLMYRMAKKNSFQSELFSNLGFSGQSQFLCEGVDLVNDVVLVGLEELQGVLLSSRFTQHWIGDIVWNSSFLCKGNPRISRKKIRKILKLSRYFRPAEKRILNLTLLIKFFLRINLSKIDSILLITSAMVFEHLAVLVVVICFLKLSCQLKLYAFFSWKYFPTLF